MTQENIIMTSKAVYDVTTQLVGSGSNSRYIAKIRETSLINPLASSTKRLGRGGKVRGFVHEADAINASIEYINKKEA